MCVDNDSRPPITPIAGGSAGGRDLKLTSADGARVMAYAARAARPTGAGMVVIPDVRGLHQYYKDLADRFAEVGVDAVAIDFFARTATTEDRSDAFDFMAQVPQTKPDQLQADFDAALRRAGVKHDSMVYPGAPHSFFDRKFTEFADASADAWKRVQTFVSQNTKR